LAQNAIPFLAVFDHHGLPLHLGRGQRLASPAQRLALIAAEKGCTRPGCTAPATLAAVHHVREWAAGGTTDIGNLTLACDACHGLVHDGPGGWKTIVLGPDSEYPGRTGWIAPPHVDPSRTPRVNQHHHAPEQLARTLARSRVERRAWLSSERTQGSPD
ncbi:HNH endonuclease signature motif containing protein, partial [Nocardia aurantiaca]